MSPERPRGNTTKQDRVGIPPVYHDNRRMSSMRAWVKMPLDALKASGGVSTSAVVVLSLIVDKCAKEHSTSAAVSRGELVQLSGASLSTVRRALAELRGLGLIESRRTGRESVYTITGAVELYPEGTFDGSARSGAQRSTRAARAAATSWDELDAAEYLALVNRFAADEGEGGEPDARIEGQMEL